MSNSAIGNAVPPALAKVCGRVYKNSIALSRKKKRVRMSFTKSLIMPHILDAKQDFHFTYNANSGGGQAF